MGAEKEPDDERVLVQDCFGFTCPVCQGPVMVGRPEDSVDDEDHLVLHAVPLCETFVAGDALAYLVKVQKAFHQVNPRLS